jgi:hypothetical protein
VNDILDFARRRPPFLSVYLTSDTATEDGARRLELTWRARRADLVDRGTPEELLTPVDAVVAEHREPGGLGVVVDGDGDVLARALPDPPPVEITELAPLPHLAPLLREDRVASVPHVIVVVDRTGADIVTVVDGEEKDTEVVTGETEQIRKVQAGGWSQRRYQQRAENTWEHNAAGVAAEVAERVRATGAELVVAAGDERALGFLRTHLPGDVGAILHVSEHGGRAPGVDEEPFLRDVRRLVATVPARRTVEELERFAELRGRGPGGPVADGPGETFTALRQALVDTLLVHEQSDTDRTAWFSASAPTLVALEARTLRDLGVEPVGARLEDVAIWSAVGSGGTVQPVPAHGPNTPLDGLGARLRAAPAPGRA